jgi:hypothetical protein
MHVSSYQRTRNTLNTGQHILDWLLDSIAATNKSAAKLIYPNTSMILVTI